MWHNRRSSTNQLLQSRSFGTLNYPGSRVFQQNRNYPLRNAISLTLKRNKSLWRIVCLLFPLLNRAIKTPIDRLPFLSVEAERLTQKCNLFGANLRQFERKKKKEDEVPIARVSFTESTLIGFDDGRKGTRNNINLLWEPNEWLQLDVWHLSLGVINNIVCSRGLFEQDTRREISRCTSSWNSIVRTDRIYSCKYEFPTEIAQSTSEIREQRKH